MASYCALAVRAICPQAQIAGNDETISVGRIPALNLNGAVSCLKAKLRRWHYEHTGSFGLFDPRGGVRRLQPILSACAAKCSK
jgi:hypothetical protein